MIHLTDERHLGEMDDAADLATYGAFLRTLVHEQCKLVRDHRALLAEARRLLVDLRRAKDASRRSQ